MEQENNQKFYYPLTSGKAASETSFGLNLFALLVATLVLIPFRIYEYNNYTNLFILFAITITVVTVVSEYLLYPKTSPLRRWKICRQADWRRIVYKEVTLLVTFGFIGLIYFLIPMFSYNDFTLQYFPFLKAIMPYIVAGSIPYFYLMDRIDPDPNDSYYKIGYAITHMEKTMSRFELGNYARSWLVKAFWLSLMQPAMIVKIRWLITYNWNMMRGDPVEWFWTANVICFFIDLAYASVGYMMSLKLFNTQTRTAEPTFFGWFVAIMCYWPFWHVLFSPFFFRYEGVSWLKTFEPGSFLFYTWFAIIITLEFLYAMATVSAGIRFSNVTYRGLWNTGLYKLTKHPAYVFKNISWWFLYMPFLMAGTTTAIKCSILLFGLNIVYYLRARTEERHLSHYPEYEAYALEMNKKSIFRWCAAILPFLKYKPLADKDRIF